MTLLSTRNLAGGFRWVKLRLRHPRLKTALFFIDKRAEIYIGPQGDLTVGNGVISLHDFTMRLEGPMHVGNDVFFNRGCHIVVKAGLTIGDRTLVGEYVSIHDEAHIIENGRIKGRNDFDAAPIVVGSDVWIGAKVTILPGVTIGDRCIIGANAVVTKDIPAGSVAAGIPAKVIKRVGE